MNKENYKKIAEIIKLSELVTGKEEEIRKDLRTRVHIANKLADYFEEEDKGVIVDSIAFKPIRKYTFNRKQFLKECGVE